MNCGERSEIAIPVFDAIVAVLLNSFKAYDVNKLAEANPFTDWPRTYELWVTAKQLSEDILLDTLDNHKAYKELSALVEQTYQQTFEVIIGKLKAFPVVTVSSMDKVVTTMEPIKKKTGAPRIVTEDIDKSLPPVEIPKEIIDILEAYLSDSFNSGRIKFKHYMCEVVGVMAENERMIYGMSMTSLKTGQNVGYMKFYVSGDGYERQEFQRRLLLLHNGASISPQEAYDCFLTGIQNHPLYREHLEKYVPKQEREAFISMIYSVAEDFFQFMNFKNHRRFISDKKLLKEFKTRIDSLGLEVTIRAANSSVTVTYADYGDKSSMVQGLGFQLLTLYQKEYGDSPVIADLIS